MTRGVLITILLLFSCFAVNGQNVHTVKRGETLESIASFYHVTIDDLKRSNDNTEMLFPGLLLTISQNKYPSHTSRNSSAANPARQRRTPRPPPSTHQQTFQLQPSSLFVKTDLFGQNHFLPYGLVALPLLKPIRLRGGSGGAESCWTR